MRIQANDIDGVPLSDKDRKFDVFHVSNEKLTRLIAHLGHSVFVDLEPEFGEAWAVWLPYDPTVSATNFMIECYAYSSSSEIEITVKGGVVTNIDGLPEDWAYTIRDE